VTRVALAIALLTALPVAAPAQATWKAIRRTTSGNMVYVSPRSVKKANGLVSALVRVVFTPPVQTPSGPWATSRVTATFDCAKRKLAAKESVYYSDAAEKHVALRTVNKLPGYGPVIDGSLGEIALTYLCAH
jgi:hypothetical protein